MIECHQCEFPLNLTVSDLCPKCGESARAQVAQGILEVDVAHNGENWDAAREKIKATVSTALLHGHSGVKIIHGWGATTGRSVLAGLTVSLLRGFAQRYSGRFAPDRGNPGAHILWLNK